MYSSKLETIDKVLDRFDSFGFKEHQYPNAIGMWKEEQEALVYAVTLADSNLNWLEIGSFMGGSAILLCLTKQLVGGAGKIVSVDIDFNAFQGAFKRNVYRIGKFQDIHQSIECSSFDLLSHYTHRLSLGFIDGWHSFKGVMVDFANVNKLLCTNGIVLFHDTAPQPYTVDDINMFYERGKRYYTEWMSEVLPNGKFASSNEYHLAEKKQNFLIDEAVAWILKTYNYELVDLPMLQGKTHFDRVAEYKHGTTSPYPGIVALRKLGD